MYSCPQTGLYFIKPHHLPSRTISVALISPLFSPSHTHTMHSQAGNCSPGHQLRVRAGPARKQHQHATPGFQGFPCCENPGSHAPTAPATGLGGCSTRTPPPQHPCQAGHPSGSPHARSHCHSRGISHPSGAQHPPAPLLAPPRATDTTRKVFLALPTPPTPLNP